MNILFWHREKTVFGLTGRDLHHHVWLVVIILAAAAAFSLLSYSKLLQFAIGVVTIFAYVLWGYIHHKLDGDLYAKNMIEYIFIALFALVILGGIYL